MIVWIASYPRSGNTLARLILARAFGCLSASEYLEESAPVGAGGGASGGPAEPTTAIAAERIGLAYLLRHEGPLGDLHSRAAPTADPVFVKTHGPPTDDSRALYIVRDGRAAVMSYFHFLRHYNGASALSVADVVRGAGGFGSWSEHLQAWLPHRRADTLLLRYEDLVGRPQVTIDAIARFIGRPPVAAWSNPFEQLNQLVPNFFRHGSDERNVAELTRADLSVFWEHHGEWMKRLGYGGPECSQ